MSFLESYLFWCSALLAGLLAAGFFMKRQVVLFTPPAPANPDLAWSQTKDNWMLCAVVWAVLIGHAWPDKAALLMAGTVVQWWLAWRTLQRIRALARAPGANVTAFEHPSGAP